MRLIFLFLCCIFVIEIFQRLNVGNILNKIADTATGALATIRTKEIPDLQKEMILRQSAWHLFRHSISLGFAVILVFSPFLIAAALSEILDRSFLDFLISVKGLVYSTLIMMGYVLIRKIGCRRDRPK